MTHPRKQSISVHPRPSAADQPSAAARVRVIDPDQYHLYPFTEQDFRRAYEEWGCNCGPSALAFALKISLDQARRAIPGFDAKRYTSPSMMRSALLKLHAVWESITPEPATHAPGMTLVRIQWTGPWTAVGANPRWKYRQTHWVATFVHGFTEYVFDCNGGLKTFESWCMDIAPSITRNISRADGGWFVTHSWWIQGRHA